MTNMRYVSRPSALRLSDPRNSALEKSKKITEKSNKLFGFRWMEI